MVFPSFVYGHPSRPLRVLVADDNEDATDSLATLLRLAGCDVAVAYEGFAVVPVAERFGPDVCVLDVRMPGIDGWEVARRLRERAGGGQILLIALTGIPGRAAADHSAAAGFDHHILKPVGYEAVFADLTSFIERSHLGQLVGP